MKLTNAIKSALPIAVLGFLALGLTSTPAAATTTNTTTFTVSATVAASCSITGTNLVFGSYTGAVTTATSAITVTCNAASTPYNVGLNVGAHGTGSYARNMANGANLLSYGLFQNAAWTTNWGTTVGTDTEAGTSSATAMTASTVTVYGQIPANQVVAPLGAYTDTITASITY
jgi:spore coat protein U-like protein